MHYQVQTESSIYNFCYVRTMHQILSIFYIGLKHHIKHILYKDCQDAIKEIIIGIQLFLTNLYSVNGQYNYTIDNYIEFVVYSFIFME